MSNKPQKLNKVFDAEILADAQTIAEKYEVVISSGNNVYYGRGLEMPYVLRDGKTSGECIQKTRKALVLTVAHLLKRGETVPVPVHEGKRTEQVNVYLTAIEKTVLGATARSRGFQGLADYIRTKVLTPHF